MRLLLRLELVRIWNGLKHLGRSPLRLVAAVLIWSLALFGVGMQVVAALTMQAFDDLPRVGLATTSLPQLQAAVFGFLLYITYHILNMATTNGLLTFTASDVDFLFPAPIDRRVVLIYKLLRDYLVMAAVVLLVGLFLSSQVSLLGGRLDRILTVGLPGLWLYLVCVQTVGHLLNLLLTFHGHRLRQVPLALKLSFVSLAVVLGLLAAGTRSTAGFAGWSRSLVDVLHSGAGRILLLPLVTAWEALLSPVSGVPAGLGLRLGIVAGLGLGLAVVLVRRPENIYEPSIGVSQFGSRLRQAVRDGDRAAVRALLLERRAKQQTRGRLAPWGRGAWALLWRSFVSTFTAPLRTLLLSALLAIGMPLFLVAMASASHQPHLLKVAPLLCLYIAYTGGMATFRQEQAELRRADLLKPLPLPAWQVIVAQMLPVTASWAGFLVLGLLVLRLAAPEVDPVAFWAVILSLPAIVAAMGLLNVCMALVFPAANDQTQTMVSGCGTMLLSMLVLGPGLVLGAVLTLLHWIGPAIGGVTAGYFGVVALIELAVAHRLYRRFEPVDL